MDPDAGRTSGPSVPGYEVLREIGRGGFATVYEARQLSVDRLVALKVISTGTLSPVTERRFRDELRAVGGLSWHPHVVGVHDGGLTDDGRPFLSMELVSGGSWGARVRRDGPLTPGRVARLGAEVADALHAAHEAGVVHRDVKPDNVLVGRRDDALLTDFGIATIADATMTATGTFVGTIEYSPPELLRGERATPLSDVYAVGALLWTLAVGRPAYDTVDGETPVASVMRVLGAPPSELPDTVPAELRAVIERAMARAPEDRFPSAAAVQDALRPLAEPSRTGTATQDPSPIDPTAVTPRPVTVTPPPEPTPPPTEVAPAPLSLDKAPAPEPPATTVTPAVPVAPEAPAAPAAPAASVWEVPGPGVDPYASAPAEPWAPPAPHWGPQPPGWDAAPAPSWSPPQPSPPTSGAAVAGLVLGFLCCQPVGIILTIVGHVQVRRGDRTGKAVVWIGYGTAVLGLLAGLGFFALGGTVLRDNNERFDGRWQTSSESDRVTLTLRPEFGGFLLGGRFEARSDGSTCTGRIIEAGSSEPGHLEIELDGSCRDGRSFDEDYSLTLEEGDQTMVDRDGTRFTRIDG